MTRTAAENQPEQPVSAILADFLSRVRFSDLPSAVIDDAKRAVLDWLGSALAGSLEPPARMAHDVVAGFGSSVESTVFGSERSSGPAAALANGIASHILEFDDLHKGSTLHPAAPIIPAALAVAEREQASGKSFLLAVVVGYEAALRIGEAVNPSHYRFWHPTGTAATFGAAAATGSLLELKPSAMLDALGSAGTQASGLWEFNADGAMSKHLHAGKAAFNGVLSADLASRGFTGATRILEGDRGFFRATSDHYDASRVTDRLGEVWKITENCYKLHSCCGHTHTAIDAALQLRSRFGWSDSKAFEQIEEIHIYTYGPGYEIVKDMNPRSPYQAKFSLAYVTATALLEGRVGLEQFGPERFDSEGVVEPSNSSLIRKTKITVVDNLTAMYPAAWPSRLWIKLKDGGIAEAGGDFPLGNPENPVSTAELEDKFRSLVVPRFGPDVAERAINAVRGIETANDMSGVFAGLA